MKNADCINFVNFFNDNFEKENFALIVKNNFSFGCKGDKGEKSPNFNLHQSRNEILDFLNFIKDKKINNYLEVGVESGGTFIFIDSFLRFANSEFEGSTGVDLKTHSTLKKRLDIYQKKYNDVKFLEMNCFDFVAEEKYDLVFIDNNLRYDNMKRCFQQYLNYTNKYICFHDILDRRYGAKRLWIELKQEYNTIEFVHSLAGIGIILL